MAKETDPATRILIVLALYSIGNEAGINAIKEMTLHDDNNEVRTFCKALLDRLTVRSITKVQ